MASNEPPGSSSVISVTSGPLPSSGNGYTYEHASKSIVVALFVNFLIAAIKLLAWWLTRSSAMLSEALHSFGDGINSIALLVGIRRSQREPDRTHPYGYGLETSFWAVLAGVLLLVFAGISAWEGIQRFYEPEHFSYQGPQLFLDPFYLSVLILLISIALELFAVYRACKAVLEEVGVPAHGFFETYRLAVRNIKQVVGPTTRFVFYEDNIALLGAVVALVAIVLSHTAVSWGLLTADVAHWPDSIASVLIGLMLMGMSIYLLRHNWTILTGTSAAPRKEKQIRDLVTSVSGVIAVHDLKTTDRGPGGLAIHMVVEVEPDTMVKDADDLIDRVKERLRTRIPHVSSVAIEVFADESDVEWAEKYNELIEQGRKDGVLKPRDEAILRNFPDFMEATAEDVMVPRTDVEAVEINVPLQEVVDLMIETGHSRIPVYEEVMDEIKGVIFARDVFEKLRNNQMDTALAELVRPIDIFPENKPASDLLEEFKLRKIQMAVVADEHGGFAGIVTLENLLEEIVGDLWDEYNAEELQFELVAPNVLMVSGKYDIEELNEKLNTGIPTDEFLTIGGYVFGTLGREPKTGDVVEVDELKLTVTEMDGHRIMTIQVESPVPFNLTPINGEEAIPAEQENL